MNGLDLRVRSLNPVRGRETTGQQLVIKSTIDWHWTGQASPVRLQSALYQQAQLLTRLGSAARDCFFCWLRAMYWSTTGCFPWRRLSQAWAVPCNLLSSLCQYSGLHPRWWTTDARELKPHRRYFLVYNLGLSWAAAWWCQRSHRSALSSPSSAFARSD